MLVAVTLLAALALGACSDDDGSPGATVTATPAPGDSPRSGPADSSAPDGSSAAGGSSTAAPDRPPGPARVVGTVARGLAVPWGLAFLPDGAAVVTERDTRRVLLRAAGRRGRAPGPRGRRRRRGGARGRGRAARRGGLPGLRPGPPAVLLPHHRDGQPDRAAPPTTRGPARAARSRSSTASRAASIHDGGRLASGPTASSTPPPARPGNRELAQDRDSLGGKILRITPDGDPAPGNPFPTPRSGPRPPQRAGPRLRRPRTGCGPRSSARTPSTSST